MHKAPLWLATTAVIGGFITGFCGLAAVLYALWPWFDLGIIAFFGGLVALMWGAENT